MFHSLLKIMVFPYQEKKIVSFVGKNYFDPYVVSCEINMLVWTLKFLNCSQWRALRFSEVVLAASDLVAHQFKKVWLTGLKWKNGTFVICQRIEMVLRGVQWHQSIKLKGKTKNISVYHLRQTLYQTIKHTLFVKNVCFSC